MNAVNTCTEFGPEVLRSPGVALGLEWLITDGTGSYASSTVIGCNTRRYHGLLVAAQQPPGDRTVLLSALDEELWVDGEKVPLSTNEYPGALFPEGYRQLAAFREQPFPEFLYAAKGAILSKTILMLRGRRAVAVRYRLKGLWHKATLKIRPLFACRGFHELASPGGQFEVERQGEGSSVVVRGGARRLSTYLQAAWGSFEEQPLWFHRVTYRREVERGFDGEEELFSPGVFTADVEQGKAFTLVAAAAPLAEAIDFEGEQREEQRRMREIADSAGKNAGRLERALAVAADKFLVSGPDGKVGIIAGYPWFEVWGRDALISLEGLTLVRGDFKSARAMLLTFADRIIDGLVPNYLAASPENDAFNSVDASLWFVHAVYRYLLYTKDDETTRTKLWPRVREILAAYTRGTRFGIRMDADGLITGGSRDTQITWMDATAHGKPVTPRHGKAVEVNALWHNAVSIAALLAERYGAASQSYTAMAERIRSSFEEVFWCEACQCLYDHVAEGMRDGRLRPNQVLAISLPYQPLSEARWGPVLAVVREHLYTAYGLRTLAPSEPEYRGMYVGKAEERDSAYHQGTVWPWLLGPFYEAYLKVHGFSKSARQAVAQALDVWSGHLKDAGLGSVSEIFDGASPHAPKGCIAQAWSVAELLRVSRLVRQGPVEGGPQAEELE